MQLFYRTDDANHKCPLCSLVYSHRSGLSRHIRTTHTPIPCNTCKKEFKSYKLFQTHICVLSKEQRAAKRLAVNDGAGPSSRPDPIPKQPRRIQPNFANVNPMPPPRAAAQRNQHIYQRAPQPEVQT